MSKTELWQGDCLELMQKIKNESIDLILCDLPYGETGNKWDKKHLNLKEVFKEYERIIKPEGAIVLTGSFKFGVQLYNIAPHLYKYDWVWVKDNGTNVPNVNYQPFRIHENVFVFGKGRVTNGNRIPMKYNPQKTQGKPYSQTSGQISKNWKGSLKNIETNNINGQRHPLTVQYFKREHGLHPTQKPLEMMEYFIKTYSNEKDWVLDNCMGSGTTGVAAKRLNRNFIGIELNEEYFNIAKERIENENGFNC